MSIFTKRIKDPVSGTAQVLSASGLGDGTASFSKCRMNLVVQAEEIPAYNVEHTQICPTKKWPFPGSVVPVTVSRSDPQRLRIDFDDMVSTEERARSQAERQAAVLRGETDSTIPDATAIQWIGGGPDDLTPEQRRKVKDLLGMDVAGGAGPASGDGIDRIARLERLARLKESGALSAEEFETEKRRILED
jgi:hypothetical protein